MVSLLMQDAQSMPFARIIRQLIPINCVNGYLVPVFQSKFLSLLPVSERYEKAKKREKKASSYCGSCACLS